MQNVAIPKDEIQDPQGLLMPDKNMSRDPERTPMQWDNSENAGFTSGKPWLRIDELYKENNVAFQKNQEGSLLRLYKQLIDFRQSEPALTTGDYYPVVTDGTTLSYIRKKQGRPSFLIVLNLTNRPAVFHPADVSITGEIIISTDNTDLMQRVASGKILQANEGILARML